MTDDPAFTRRLLLGHGLGAALALPTASLRAASLRAVQDPARHSVTLRPAPLIILDPGHGGRDPGAIGFYGTYEKHISLAAAVELARRLRGTGRYRVVLTRENDSFIALDDRVEIAQEVGASLFISLHADAVGDHTVRGASVYTLAASASDAQTAKLAAHENSAGAHPAGEADVSPKIAEILASLVRHETRAGSACAQQSLVQSIGIKLPLLGNPARHAGFAVLKAADIPSVLVEMGFMSNPYDEAALRQPSHRVIMAKAIHGAIDAYFAANGQLARLG